MFVLLPIKDYNPTQRPAILTGLFIAINVVLFVYQSYLAPQPLDYHIAKSALVPYEITHLRTIDFPAREYIGDDYWGRPLFQKYYVERTQSPLVSLVVAMFMHGSLLHLLFNMLFLWIFGNNVEDALGRVRFFFFYLIAGIGASLVHVVFNLNSLVPMVGASGAISAVMGAYLVLFPRARVRTLVWIFFFITFADLPAGVFLVFWFLLQLFPLGSGVAWLAHAGGFLIGYLWLRARQPGRPARVEFIP